MTKSSRKRALSEIFGYAPDDLTPSVRKLWSLGACPFINGQCIKINHDQSIIYGTCSVTNGNEEVIICPNRLYANDYKAIKVVAQDAFGPELQFYSYSEFIKNRKSARNCVVALGLNSGKEIKIRSMSMDWVLAVIRNDTLVEYAGIEVQSIDITGNYRDAWHAYKNISKNRPKEIPASAHGLNWANVHKRLMPQLIRKGLVYSRSELVKRGVFFVLPDSVYKKFEEIIGDIPLIPEPNRHTLTVHTYDLGPEVKVGKQRELVLKRKISFLLEDFSARFVSGPNLPPGTELDGKIRATLGLN